MSDFCEILLYVYNTISCQIIKKCNLKLKYK